MDYLHAVGHTDPANLGPITPALYALSHNDWFSAYYVPAIVYQVSRNFINDRKRKIIEF